MPNYVKVKSRTRLEQVGDCLVKKMTNGQIADKLGLKPHSANVYVRRLMRKTGTTSRYQAAEYIIQHGGLKDV